MSRKSQSFAEKLHKRLNLVQNGPDRLVESQLEDMLNNVKSKARFDSKQELQDYLSEGALLNINTLASDYLSIPSGKYVVWTTDLGNTMLVPSANLSINTEIYETPTKDVEVYTPRLLGAWSKVERVMYEDEGSKSSSDDKWKDEEVDSKWSQDASKIDRTAFANAIKRSGKSQAEIASEVGVGEPTVSRWLQDGSKSTGRDPTLDHLNDLSSVLGASIDSLGFNPKHRHKKRKSNRGSGRGGAGSTSKKGNKDYSKGNAESFLRDGFDLMEGDIEGFQFPRSK